MNHDQLREKMLNAIDRAPRPVTKEHALALANVILLPDYRAEAEQFEKWLDANADSFLRRLNG